MALIEAELEKLRPMLLDPDRACAARLMMATVDPLYRWLHGEAKIGAPADKVLNAIGQLFGNMAIMAVTRMGIPSLQRQEAIQFVFNTAVGVVGQRSRPSGLIIPGR